MQRVDIIGVQISDVNMNSAIKYLKDNMNEARGNYICVSNVHTTVTAHDDPDYRKVQNGSFMSLPDGKPLSVYGKKHGHLTMDRVTGPEFMERILKDTENTDYKHYFYGTTDENLNEFIDYVKNRYPNLKIAGYEPSVFRPLTSEEEDELCNCINESNADFVWVALGAPRQEIFEAKLCKRTNAVWTAVGGAFNVISGVIPRAPKWMQDHSLEWLYRWSKEPKRLFKRYFVTNTRYLYLIHKKH